MALSEYADWWDTQKHETEDILSDWVQDNPQWWAVVLAASVQALMDLGAGFVDVLRFGEGAAEGGFKGYGKDALRLLMLLGPLGKAGGAASRFLTPLVRGGRLRLAVQVAGVDGPCTFQAINNASSIAKGKNIFVTVPDMAGGVGRPVSQLTRTAGGLYELGAWVDDLVPHLRQLGVRIKQVNGLSRIDDVIAVARRETGPVVFAIRTTVRNAAGATEEILHSVIAMRTPTGAVRFADYGRRYVRSLTELVTDLGYGTPVGEIELYQAGSSATIIEGAVLTGEWMAKLARGAVIVMEGLVAIETNENGVELAVPATLAASTAPVLDAPVAPDVVKASFEAYKTRAKGKPVPALPHAAASAGRKTAPRSDWLTGVQYRLNALGFGAGPVDGINGPRTKKAVLAFQRAYPPLRIDAISGPRTQAKLVQVCGY